MPITALRVAAVVVYASDIERSRVFYEELLGLKLTDRTSDPHDPHWGDYVQRVYFALQHRPSQSKADQKQGKADQKQSKTDQKQGKTDQKQGKTDQTVAFSLEVEELEVMVAKLRCAGARIAVPPSKRSYGSIAGVLDPDGNLVYLHQPPSAVEVPPTASPRT